MRNRKIDYIKGITIILMIFGHCIQFGSGLTYENACSFFSNRIFQLIYSFHMPLFMSISGYYFSYSIKKYSKLSIVLRKCHQLLLPVFAWSSLRIIMIAVVHKSEFNIKEYLSWWINDSYRNFWFIWSVFILCIIVLFVNTLFKDHILVYILLLAALLLIPDKNIGSYKFMYPYFVCGYLIGKKGIPLGEFNWLKSKKWAIAYMCIFSIGFFFFNAEILTDMNYYLLSSQALWKDCLKILYKYFMGFIGTLAIISCIYVSYKECKINNIICLLGQETLGIYVIQVLLNHIVLRVITQNINHNIFVNLLETVIELLACHILIWIVNRTKWTRFLFLGKSLKGA